LNIKQTLIYRCRIKLGFRTIKGTGSREQRIRISPYQKSCIEEYTVSDRLKFLFSVLCSLFLLLCGVRVKNVCTYSHKAKMWSHMLSSRYFAADRFPQQSSNVQRLISRFARLGTIFYCQILLFYAKNANKHNFTEIEGEEWSRWCTGAIIGEKRSKRYDLRGSYNYLVNFCTAYHYM